MYVSENNASQSENAPDHFYKLAFENSLQPNIIFKVDGSIYNANQAACKLLNYSKTELSNQTRASIFDVNESSFERMLHHTQSTALVTAIKNNGERMACDVTFSTFADESGNRKSIITISSMLQSAILQKEIDRKRNKIVEDNIALATFRQKNIDKLKDKRNADNIMLARSKQKAIDVKNKKTVAGNIAIAKEKQKLINVRKDKIVIDNIVRAKLKQRDIDTKNDKIVNDNIVFAKSKQKAIDIKKAQIVNENILIALSKQRQIDAINSKIVLENITLAKLKQKAIDVQNEKIVARNVNIAKQAQKGIDTINKKKVADDILIAKTKQQNIDILKEKVVADNILIAKEEQKNIDLIREKVVADNIIIAQAKSDARHAENTEWIRNLGVVRETERLALGNQLNDNVNQLLCSSRSYLNMAKQGGSKSEIYLNRSSECTLTAIEELRKFTKLLTTQAIENSDIKNLEDVVIENGTEGNSTTHIEDLDNFLEKVNRNTLNLAEKEAEEIEQTFETMANNIPNLAWMADEDGWIFWFNKRWYQYTASTQKEMEGWGWKSVHDPEKLTGVLEQWALSIQSGQPFEMIYPIKGADNIFHPFLTKVIPLRNSNGKVIRWFGTSTDISNQLEMDRIKDNFLIMASHELKTPVTTIKAYGQIAEMMLEKKGDVETLAVIKRLGTSVNKFTGLLEDLLDITKIQKGKLLYNEAVYDSNEIIDNVVDEMQMISACHEIKKELGTSAGIFVDKDKLGQVLNNLISNAIKYSPASDSVIVSSELQEEGIQIGVRDFGIGISAEEQKNIFKQFYRVDDNDHSTFPGMGIGLYICSEIISRQQGRIWVESNIGKGSTFYIWLPLHQINS